MPFTRPPLPYAPDALEPHIDAQTMTIHSEKHHQAYVDNLNKALADQPDLQKHDIESLMRNIGEVPAAIKQAVVNNGGGHANHTLFFKIMGPNGGGEPNGAIADAITEAFGSFAKLKETVNANGGSQFGSGWSWVVMDPATKKLVAVKKPNQDSPLMDGHTPIFGVDVWEHSYYLKYQNARPKYLEAWWNTIDWAKVNEVYEAAKSGQ